MAEKYDYRDVIIDPADPRVEIGKEYFFSDVPGEVISKALKDDYARKLIGISKKNGNPLPFMLENNDWAWICLIRKKDVEKRYVPFDLSKPEVRDRLRGQWIRLKTLTEDGVYEERMITDFTCVNGFWSTRSLDATDLLLGWTFLDDTPCGEAVPV